jgi:hypothetical protein
LVEKLVNDRSKVNANGDCEGQNTPPKHLNDLGPSAQLGPDLLLLRLFPLLGCLGLEHAPVVNQPRPAVVGHGPFKFSLLILDLFQCKEFFGIGVDRIARFLKQPFS